MGWNRFEPSNGNSFNLISEASKALSFLYHFNFGVLTVFVTSNVRSLIQTRESTLPEWTEREFVLIKSGERREIKQVRPLN